ncbi:Uncharacterized protein HZ326_16064 [Fusarium oxysporum f. sp. albedinis]|nr:Uncharacterized protein HZ326_16064 [Fusarium oxysporum f. sp. albedinis]
MMTMETGNDQLIRATFSDRPRSSDGGPDAGVEPATLRSRTRKRTPWPYGMWRRVYPGSRIEALGRWKLRLWVWYVCV